MESACFCISFYTVFFGNFEKNSKVCINSTFGAKNVRKALDKENCGLYNNYRAPKGVFYFV